MQTDIWKKLLFQHHSLSNMEIQRDSVFDFTGGMDTSRQPYAIEPNKFFKGCNVMVPRFTGRLSNRVWDRSD